MLMIYRYIELFSFHKIDFKISSALPAALQLGAIIKSKNCTNLNQSQQQQHNRYCHGSEDIELLSPIHSTSRVPAVSQHIIVPKNREPVSHTRQHQSNHNAESPLQTPVRARRKFPGPAGLLPKIVRFEILYIVYCMICKFDHFRQTQYKEIYI